ncbi:molybdopterin molybdenumtransferase MoeA [Paenibacillus psychroresistens]|uniref:Molybdopterin molybdenumtransferase n=1 Tax=Paenibacillus psychroresistens TaxID=1778678 RepID=A0A6B8RFY8_9BACL|nr:gephyrin-like molybdotransferase Glp [Paenibacillus psychroresistens]QGQ94495.1 molybdopterin molybdenumtransferase MoeA [Paenibacillus psychroresistens]
MNTYPLHIDEAQQKVISSLSHTTQIIRVPLQESAGYILGEAIQADTDVPLFDRSMMDGFAVRSEDTVGASFEQPISFRVIEEIPAGATPLKQLKQGEAARIMTGAMLPLGADAVCRFEATKDAFQTGVIEMKLLAALEFNENVARQGEDIRKGSQVLTPGMRIGAAEIAVLATFGISEVPVYRKPVVAILSSGSELIEVSEPIQPGKIRNSNSLMVAELIRQAGGQPLLLKSTSDDIDLLTNEIKLVIDQIDMLVTTGGVSVGDFDVIPDVYANLEAETIFWKILIKPGSPFRYAMRGKIPFFGISGNPAASFVNSQLFVLPALRKLSGQSVANLLPPMSQAKLATAQPLMLSAVKQTRFLRATAYLQEGILNVTTAEGQSSGMIGSLVHANCLIRLDGGVIANVGETLPVLLFGEVHVR